MKASKMQSFFCWSRGCQHSQRWSRSFCRTGSEPGFYERSCKSLPRHSPDLFCCTAVQEMQSWFLCQQCRFTSHLRQHSNDENTCTKQAGEFYLAKTQRIFQRAHQPLLARVQFALQTFRFSNWAVVCRKSQKDFGDLHSSIKFH